jgi:hypothetical protein
MPYRKEKENGKDDNGLVVAPSGAPRKPYSCLLSMNVVAAGEGANLLDAKDKLSNIGSRSNRPGIGPTETKRKEGFSYGQSAWQHGPLGG